MLAFLALNAFAGGYYGMAGAKGVPTEWLTGSPFSSYFLPSVVLFVVVGGSCLFAAITVLAKHRLGRPAALISGCVLIIWIVAQLRVIGYVSWLQPAVLCGGGAVLALATRLRPHTG